MILLFVACSTNKLRLRSDNRFSYQGKFKNKFYGIQLLPDNRFVYEEGSIKYGRSSKGTWTSLASTWYGSGNLMACLILFKYTLIVQIPYIDSI